MSLFHSILSQLQGKLNARHADMDVVAATVSEVLRIPIASDQLAIRDKVLTIKIAPTVKMALKLKQQALMKALAAKGVNVTAIR